MSQLKETFKYSSFKVYIKVLLLFPTYITIRNLFSKYFAKIVANKVWGINKATG